MEKHADTQVKVRSFMMQTGLLRRRTCLQTETLSTATPRLYRFHGWDFKSDWTPWNMWLKSWDSGKRDQKSKNWKSTLVSVLGETESPAWKHQFHQPCPFQKETFSWLCHKQFHATSRRWQHFSRGWEESRNTPQWSRQIRSPRLIRERQRSGRRQFRGRFNKHAKASVMCTHP